MLIENNDQSPLSSKTVIKSEKDQLFLFTLLCTCYMLFDVKKFLEGTKKIGCDWANNL